VIALLLFLAAAEPVPVETMLSAADNAMRQNKPERARLMLDEARKSYPKDGRVDFMAAMSYAQQEKDEEAITAYRAAIVKTPTLRHAYLQLAMLLDVLERYDQSDEVYREATKQFPKDAELFYEWGTTLILRKRFKEAEVALRTALAISPRDAQTMADLAFVEYKLGKPKDAVKRYELAYKTGTVDKEMRRHYADALAGAGELDNAEAIYTELLAAASPDADLWYRRGKVRAAKGDKAGAAADNAEWEKRKKK